MKNLFAIVLATALCVCFMACKNETKKDNNATASENVAVVETPASPTTDPHAGHDHAGHDHDEKPVHIKSSPMSPYIGIWKYHFSTWKTEYYKNRWIEFFADGTFENGIGGKQTNKGKWTLDPQTNLIDLDYEDNSKGKEFDEQWKGQIHPPVLLLLGNTPKNPDGGQIKLDQIEARPKS